MTLTAIRALCAVRVTPQRSHIKHKHPALCNVLRLSAVWCLLAGAAGAKSAADIKLALRKELMRWHPDKFTAKYGARLAAADKDAIQAGVHAVAQQLTGLKQQ